MLEHIVDHERDELLRELIRPIVVGTAGDVDGKFVGVRIRLDKEVSRSFGRGIGAVGVKRGGLHKIPGFAERAVDFVGGHLKEFHSVFVLVIPSLPGVFGDVEQVDGTEDICCLLYTSRCV